MANIPILLEVMCDRSEQKAEALACRIKKVIGARERAKVMCPSGA